MRITLFLPNGNEKVYTNVDYAYENGEHDGAYLLIILKDRTQVSTNLPYIFEREQE